MADDARARLKEWLASGQARLVPLTFPQRELWETAPVPPDDPGNTIRSLLDIRGPLTRALCEDAMRLVIARQEVLRTSILPGKERPVQLVRTTAEPALTYRELDLPDGREEDLLAATAEHFDKSFDLVKGPLYRLDMIRRGPDHFALALAIHHSIADGWTVTSFVEDFCTACIIVWRNSGKDMSRLQGLRDALPDLPVTYSAWGAAERARWTPEEIAAHAAHWRQRLGGTKPVFASAGPDLGSVDKWLTHLPADLAEPVRALARREGATLFETLLAAFRVALFLWNGTRDTVLGTPVAGRAKTNLRETMGYFSGIVPLRGTIDPDLPFREALQSVHRETVDDFARAMPFAELAAAVAQDAPRRRHAVYDVRFAVQNHPFPGIEIPGVSTKLRTISSGTTRFDLACELTEEGKKMELIWMFRPTAVTRGEVESLDRLYRSVLSAVARDPSLPPAAIKV